MLRFICNTANISGKSIGNIDLKGVFTFFEVQDEEVNKVFEGFKGIDFNGRQVRIEVSGEGRSDRGGDRGSRPRSADRGGKGRSGGFGGERRDRGGDRRGGFGGERRERGGDRRGGFGGERRERSSDNGGFRDFSGKRRESKSRY